MRASLISVIGPEAVASGAANRMLRSVLGTLNAGDLLVLVIRGTTVSLPPEPSQGEVVIHLAPERLSLSAGRNLGLAVLKSRARLTGGDIVGFPDDDCWYFSWTLPVVRRWFGEDLSRNALCGRYDDLAQGTEPLPSLVCTELVLGDIFRRISSVSAFLRGDVTGGTGLFDERLGVGAPIGAGEECDYFARALRAGAHGAFTDSVLVGHPVREQRRNQYFAANIAVLAKHGFLLRPFQAENVRATLLLGRRILRGLIDVSIGRLPRAVLLESALKVRALWRA